MKHFYLTLLFTLASSCVFAVPAKRGVWQTVRLADGTEVKVELRGDEFCKYWRAADGRNFVMNAKTKVYEEADMDLIARKAHEMRRSAFNSGQGISKPDAAESRISYTGKKKGLIILVQFEDKKFKDEHTPDLYRRIVNEIGYNDPEFGFKGSVKDYFLSQSYGQMEFDFDIVGPVTLPQSYRYYGKNSPYTGSDERPGEMIADACKAVDDEVDFSLYDWDGNKDIEQVFVIYAGHGEASYHDPNTVWPHKYSIYASTGKRLTLDGVRVDTYACSCELGTGESIDGIGCICHEFSHCLGLPDFYDVDYGGAYGTGDWDIMCMGSYNDNAFCPAGYTAYERMAVGWLDPVELKKNITVESMKPLGDSKEAYIIYNDNNKDEYYIMENRQQTGWDKALPGSGLLITHIDYDKRIWNYNCPNSPSMQAKYNMKNPHERCALFLANNNRLSPEGNAYPYGGNNSLTNTTSPAAKLYNSNTDGTFYMNKAVKEISVNGDGTVSFVFENNNKNENDYDLPETYSFYESFDKCNGNGGNDGQFAGSTVGKGTFVGYTDIEGWDSESGHGADRCAMFGSSIVAGQVVTPEISISGESHLLFKAAPYTGDGTALMLSVAEGDAVLSDTELVMKEGSWSVYDVTIKGSGAVKLEIKAEKRFFLDKVCVTVSPSSGIGIMSSDGKGKTRDGRIYSVDGRYVGKDMNALKKGIYIVNGKKVIK